MDDRQSDYMTWNPEASERVECWVIHHPPKPEPVYIGVLGGTETWMK